MNGQRHDSAPYEPPTLQLLGTVSELTLALQPKKDGWTDGMSYQGVSITNASG
jgi:hypothetical protein